MRGTPDAEVRSARVRRENPRRLGRENPRQIGVRDANVGGGMRGAGGRVEAHLSSRVSSAVGRTSATLSSVVVTRGAISPRRASDTRLDATPPLSLRARRVSRGEGFSASPSPPPSRIATTRRRRASSSTDRRMRAATRPDGLNPVEFQRRARVRLGGGTRGRPSPRDAPFRRARDVALGDGRMDG